MSEIGYKIKSVAGRGLPLAGNDIDTDRIIPARYLKCVTFDGLGQYAFYDSRFNEDGTQKDHPFNDRRYDGASILIVNRNFGCGSSREHAPQSLFKFGIRGIIGESFAEIFADNCTAIGLPVVTAGGNEINQLAQHIRQEPGSQIRIDLEKKEALYAQLRIAIQQPEQLRISLLHGTWDSTAELLSVSDKIKEVADRLK